MQGVVCKALVNADGSPFLEVAIAQAMCYKASKVSPTVQALVALVKDL